MLFIIEKIYILKFFKFNKKEKHDNMIFTYNEELSISNVCSLFFHK